MIIPIKFYKMSVNKGRALKIIIAVILALCASNTAMAEATDSVYARVNAPSEVVVDSDFTAVVNIRNLVNFDAGQFDINFDTAVLRLDDITDGQIGDTIIKVVLLNEIEPGSVRIIMNVLGIPGVSGSGHLAILHFHVIGDVGSSSVIDLTNEFINNNKAEQISVEEWADCSVSIVDGGLSIAMILGIGGGIVGISSMIGIMIRYWMKRRMRPLNFFDRLPQVERTVPR